MEICPNCGLAVNNLRRHVSRRRCKMQGAAGVKAGKPSGTLDRRVRPENIGRARR